MTKEDIPQISERSKKQDILNAYHEALKKLAEKRETEMKPEQKAEEKRVREVVRVADAMSLDGVSQSLNQLKSELGKALSLIMEKLEGEVSRYETVKRAVEAQEKELSEIYEIQKAATSLAALIETQDQQRTTFEAEMKRIREQWELEKMSYESELKERKEQEEKQRKREREEYEYQFKREKQAARDRLADEKAALEKALQEKQEIAEKTLAEREHVISERESKVEFFENRIKELEANRDQAVQTAVQEATERLQKDFESREARRQTEFEGERNVLKTQIQSLEETVKGQNAQIIQLSKQLEKASQQVQDIAVKAVEGSSYTKLASQLDVFQAERKRGLEAKPESK